MPENSIVSTLIQSFAPAKKEDWKRAASRETNNGYPIENLSWKNSDQIRFFPYYDREDLKAIRQLPQFHLRPSKNAYSGARSWLCTPRVTVSDAGVANKTALDHLNNGAEAILFHVQQPAVSLDDLLSEIEWPYCPLFFTADHHAQRIQDYIIRKQLIDAPLEGGLLWTRLPSRPETEFLIAKMRHFRSLGLIIEPSTPVREIASALIRGTASIDAISDGSVNLEQTIRAIGFSLTAGKNFLETVAKMKALRGLWFQVAHGYGVQQFGPDDLYLHVRTEPLTEQFYQPHGNMIYATLSAMAAIVGGADALTVSPEQEGNALMDRVARNVSSVLREEAHLNLVADPLAGSYALEVMTHEIARQAWALFQSEWSRR